MTLSACLLTLTQQSLSGLPQPFPALAVEPQGKRQDGLAGGACWGWRWRTSIEVRICMGGRGRVDLQALEDQHIQTVSDCVPLSIWHRRGGGRRQQRQEHTGLDSELLFLEKGIFLCQMSVH